jgi:hypothetical protein
MDELTPATLGNPITSDEQRARVKQDLAEVERVLAATGTHQDDVDRLREELAVSGVLDGAELVQVAGHPVSFDPERRLWFCDIQVTGAPDATYFPFLRLALARYQPQSIPGAELSRMVLADVVQVPPQRTVTLGPDPASQGGVFHLRVEGAGSGPSQVVGPAPDLVEVSVEQRIPGTTDELGWAPAASTGIEVRASAAVKAGAPLFDPLPPLWEGTVRLPQHAAGELRIVVRELEHLATDPAPDAPSGTSGSGSRLLVFAETIPV